MDYALLRTLLGERVMGNLTVKVWWGVAEGAGAV